MYESRISAAGIGPIGVWLSVLAEAPGALAAAAAAEIEQLGYDTLWIGESPQYKEVFTHSALLLASTSRLTVATGIASVWGRAPTTAYAAAQTLGEAYPGRFVLGLGVGHAEAGRGYRTDKPLTTLREYLDEIERMTYRGPRPAETVPVVLAALRPRMQELARERADGMHSFFVSPEHTREARERLGPEPLLAPEQAVVLSSDPTMARALARRHVATRLRLRNYIAHVRALGFDEDDLTDGGSDRLVDTLVAWGEPETVAARIRDHLQAGADHVAVHPLTSGGAKIAESLAALRELAPALALTPPRHTATARTASGGTTP